MAHLELWNSEDNIWATTWQNQQNECAQWVAKNPSFLYADSEDSDQTGPGWSVFAGRTVTLLVLPWGCSFIGIILSRDRIAKTLIRLCIAQSDLRLCCSHMALTGFAMTQLNYDPRNPLGSINHQSNSPTSTFFIYYNAVVSLRTCQGIFILFLCCCCFCLFLVVFVNQSFAPSCHRQNSLSIFWN